MKEVCTCMLACGSKDSKERHGCAPQFSPRRLNRLSATRVACRRGSNASKKSILDTDGGTTSLPTVLPGCTVLSTSADIGLGNGFNSSQLASAALGTSNRIIGRSIKLGDACGSDTSSALDVSDISIHLPTINPRMSLEERGGDEVSTLGALTGAVEFAPRVV